MSQITKILTSAGPIPSNIPTSFLLDDTNSAIPASNVIKVTGAAGVDTSLGASNEIVINVVSAGFQWSEQNGSFNAAIENGYFCNVALTATLPTTAGPPALAIGNTIIFYVDVNAVNIIIQASTGQRIEVGGAISAAGGTATANVQGSMLELVFKVSDLTWHAISSVGSWVIV